ncbi:N-acetyltransferase GCN5 [Planoprotostelium fungivorum]|uniref:N-acetyltransferase GCN5 n=1 Tax=Planoprotostelium fungivorum TaxID=1890364 RepID=A0A2P6NTR7_9EUKA|nr:N-acetyltransferase GCN5 [Planoprotostelium fungivorum]
MSLNRGTAKGTSSARVSITHVAVVLLFSVLHIITDRHDRSTSPNDYFHRMSMSIRLSTEEDIPGVMALVKSVVPLMNASGNFQWTEAYPTEEIPRRCEPRHLWVSTEHGVILGCACIVPRAFEADYKFADWDISQPYVVVHRLAVSPAARGKGLTVALLTHAENKPTLQLFPKLGYRFAGEIELDYRPGLRFVCYEKKVQD